MTDPEIAPRRLPAQTTILAGIAPSFASRLDLEHLGHDDGHLAVG